MELFLFKKRKKSSTRTLSFDHLCFALACRADLTPARIRAAPPGDPGGSSEEGVPPPHFEERSPKRERQKEPWRPPGAPGVGENSPKGLKVEKPFLFQEVTNR